MVIPMPNKALEEFRVPRVKGVDKRIKLTPEQRAEIKENVEGLSDRKLAYKFGVSRRLVLFIRDPEKQQENLRRRAERGGTMQYYDHQKHAATMAVHRAHKRNLLTANDEDGRN